MLPSGSTAKCLGHFLRSYDWEEIQDFMARFCRVNKSTVRRWLNGTMPKGYELIKVRVLLDLAGYRVGEFDELPPPVRQFAYHIAFDRLSIEEAQDLLGYSKAQEVYRVLLKGTGLYPQRQYRLVSYVERSKEELEEASIEIRRELSRLPIVNDIVVSFDIGDDDLSLEEVRLKTDNEPIEDGLQHDCRWTDGEAANSFVEAELAAQVLVQLLLAIGSLSSVLGEGAEADELRRNIRFAVGSHQIENLIRSLEKILA